MIELFHILAGTHPESLMISCAAIVIICTIAVTLGLHAIVDALYKARTRLWTERLEYADRKYSYLEHNADRKYSYLEHKVYHRIQGIKDEQVNILEILNRLEERIKSRDDNKGRTHHVSSGCCHGSKSEITPGETARQCSSDNKRSEDGTGQSSKQSVGADKKVADDIDYW